MTSRQREILNFVGEFIDEKGYSPSFQDIAVATKLRSLATVSKHVDGLIAQGKMVKVANTKRSLEIVDSIPQNRFKLEKSGKLWDTALGCYWTREGNAK